VGGSPGSIQITCSAVVAAGKHYATLLGG